MDFLDYYEILQISPNAEAETIHRVFRILAARFHPDNPETGDSAKFIRLAKAYEVLSNPQLRADYDSVFAAQPEAALAAFGSKDFVEGVEVENNRRIGVLCLLYRQRRFHPDLAGLNILQLERLMNIPREHLLFTIWFLQEKKWIAFTEQSDYVITGEGTEFIEGHSPKQQSLQRLLSTPQNGRGPDTAEEQRTRAAKAGR
ncbi:MAG: J domain-containing protein [Candidatus Solibacter usitatus]|nr:J domain-containing protein [Candidatus Solibacter usitatus]